MIRAITTAFVSACVAAGLTLIVIAMQGRILEPGVFDGAGVVGLLAGLSTLGAIYLVGGRDE